MIVALSSGKGWSFSLQKDILFEVIKEQTVNQLLTMFGIVLLKAQAAQVEEKAYAVRGTNSSFSVLGRVDVLECAPSFHPPARVCY